MSHVRTDVRTYTCTMVPRYVHVYCTCVQIYVPYGTYVHVYHGYTYTCTNGTNYTYTYTYVLIMLCTYVHTTWYGTIVVWGVRTDERTFLLFAANYLSIA